MDLQDVFYLLPPQQLPKRGSEMRSAPHQTSLLTHLSQFILTHDDHAIIQTAEALLLELTPQEKNIKRLTEDKHESSKNKENDIAFNIIRINADVIDTLSYSSVKAFYGIFQDVRRLGTSLSPREWGTIHLAYAAIFNLYAGDRSMGTKEVFDKVPQGGNEKDTMNGERAYQRWVNGHYVFMTVTQAMIIALECFCAEVDALNDACALYYLSVATLCMQASEVTLKYAGDFSDKAYIDGVRPTLMPPTAKPQMSGLYWRDHEYLIKHTFKKLHPIFINPPVFINQPITAFKAALRHAYDAHKHVCNHFVGKEEPSLLSTKPAVEVLEIFKTSRLRLLTKDRIS